MVTSEGRFHASYAYRPAKQMNEKAPSMVT